MSDNIRDLRPVPFGELLHRATDRFFDEHPELDFDVDAGWERLNRWIEDRERRKSMLSVVRDEEG